MIRHPIYWIHRVLVFVFALIVALPMPAQEPNGRLAETFKRLDKNGDGKLTLNEAPDRVGFIQAADTDQSGDASLEEIRTFLEKNRPAPPDAKAKPKFLVTEIFPEDAPISEASCRSASQYSAQRRGYSMLVMHDGKVLFERYDQGFTVDRPHRLASGTKSFSGAILAAAVNDGLLSIDEPVSKTIIEWKDDPRLSQITIRQILSLTSGIDPGENGEVPPYSQSFQTEARNVPGAKFAYGPRAFQIFGELIDRKLAESEVLEFPDPLAYLQVRVFEPIGMKVAGWRRDAEGMPYLPSGAALTAREWVKYGAFLLRHGEWDGQPLVDADTLAECLKGSDANPGYGLTFWLLDAGKDTPAVLEGAYMAAGAGKQRLFVIPKLNLAVVRQGESRQFDNREFLNRLLNLPAPAPSP